MRIPLGNPRRCVWRMLRLGVLRDEPRPRDLRMGRRSPGGLRLRPVRGARALFRERDGDACGECAEGCVQDDTDCLPEITDCDEHRDRPDGVPTLHGVSSRLYPGDCSTPGSEPSSYGAGFCTEVSATNETVSVGVDCSADVEAPIQSSSIGPLAEGPALTDSRATARTTTVSRAD